MRMMGLRTSAFWASWITYGAAVALASTLVLQAAGYSADFDFFTNSSYAATFLLFFSFSLAMLALAILLSTVITSARTAQTVGYSVILIGFVLQFIITSAYAGMLDLMFAEKVRWLAFDALLWVDSTLCDLNKLCLRVVPVSIHIICVVDVLSICISPSPPAGDALGAPLPLRHAAVPSLQLLQVVL